MSIAAVLKPARFVICFHTTHSCDGQTLAHSKYPTSSIMQVKIHWHSQSVINLQTSNYLMCGYIVLWNCVWE